MPYQTRIWEIFEGMELISHTDLKTFLETGSLVAADDNIDIRLD